jgi:GNAT superfamily N-acetyltransferase
MWRIALLALAAAPPASDPGVTVDGQAFGPAQAMACIWFSNFESSRFESCRAAGRDVLRPGESASLQCRPGLCDTLDARAARAAHWRKHEPVWGEFVVRLVGRVARTAHEPRYRGDGTRTVLIEKLLGVAKRGTPVRRR